MEAFRKYQEAKLQLLRRDIREALDDLERGAVADGDKVFRDLERENEPGLVSNEPEFIAS